MEMEILQIATKSTIVVSLKKSLDAFYEVLRYTFIFHNNLSIQKSDIRGKN